MSDEEQLIKIEIFDIHASSTILKVVPNTTAAYVCEAVANKIDVAADQIKFYNLILLVTWFNDFNSRNYTYLRTIKSNEKVISTYYGILKKLSHKLPAAARRILKRNSGTGNNSYGLVGSPGEVLHTNDSLNRVIKTKWIYKDMRTTPLDYIHSEDVSANSSSSDDEEEISIDDLSYLQQFERRSYLLCRSKKDPNLWKKRFCVLVDNLWCIDYRIDSYYYTTNHNTPIARRKKPKAKCIKIKGNFRIYDKVHGFDYPYCIALQLPSSGNTQNLIFLRGMNESDQSLWIHDIQKRAIINLENEQIHMAELIMSDEVNLQSDRIVKDMTSTLDNLFQFDMILTWQHNNDSNDNISYDDDNDSCFIDSSSNISNNDLSIDQSNSPIISNVMSTPTETNVTIQSIQADNYIDEEILENDIIAIHKNLDSFIESSNNKYNDSYINTLTSLQFHIHRYCNNSLLHRLHYKYPKITSMLQFINDVNKYKHYHRVELFPTSRQLWILTMTIYEKYLLNQLTLFNQFMNSNEEIYDNSNKVDSKTDNKIENSIEKDLYSHKTGKNHLMNHHIGYWDIDSDVLLEVHGKIFSNIHRQIAGFNVLSRNGSSKRLVSDDNSTVDSDNITTSVSSETSINGTVSTLSWLWGNTRPQIDQKTNYNNYDDIHNNTYITIDELTLKTNYHSNKNNNKPMYQIVNINDFPSIDIFDNILYQVVLKIKLYCNKNKNYKYYDKIKRLSSNTINHMNDDHDMTISIPSNATSDNNDEIIS